MEKKNDNSVKFPTVDKIIVRPTEELMIESFPKDTAKLQYT